MNRKLYRNFAKKFYAGKKKEERPISLKINALVQTFHIEMRKLPTQEGAARVQELLKDLKQLRSTPRFVRDFPSFSMFWQYLKKEEITMGELKEI